MINVAKTPFVQKFAHWLAHPLSFWMVALALLLISILSYGVHIPAWGLYGDDWIYLYSYHATGAGGFINFVQADRPFSFWIYALVTPIVGEQVWLYHLLLMMVRWVGAVLLVWMIQLLVPRQRHLAIACGVLFLVYPGFGQQPLALQFVLHFTILALTIFSFSAMVIGVRQQRPWVWRVFSWLTALVSLFSLEYFFGYELLRPVILWMAHDRLGLSHKIRARRVLSTWLPFLIIGAAFAAWRVFIFKFPFYQPEMLELIRQSPFAGISALVTRVFTDFKVVLYDAWRQTITIPINDRAGYFLLVVMAFIIGFLIIRHADIHTDRSAGFNFVLFSLLLLLAAGIPFWVTDIPVELAFPWDRSTLPFMLGAAVFTSGLLEWVLRPGFFPFVLAVLIALAVGYHSLNARTYAAEWDEMRAYFWQLTWRVPDLADETILLSDEIPLYKHSDNDLTPVVNWTYRPENQGARYAFQFFDLSTREEPPIPSFQPGLEVIKGYRSFRFEGTTDMLLTLYWRPPGCLRVFDLEQLPYADLPQTILDAHPYSNLDVIQPGNSVPPVVFGAEPEHAWCYYYQKAELAFQNSDWQEVSHLADAANAGGWHASQPGEYLPFLAAAVHSGDLVAAQRLHEQIMATPGDLSAVCYFWHTASANDLSGSALYNLAQQAKANLECGP